MFYRVVKMKLSVLAITAILITLGVTSPASAQDPCWQDGKSVNCWDRTDEKSDPYVNLNKQNQDGLYRDINRIYREVLGRNANRNEFRTYANQVQNGKSLESVRNELANSNEARDAINRIYQETLGRDADQSGLSTYISRLQNGWSLERVRRNLANSQEARDRRQTPYSREPRRSDRFREPLRPVLPSRPGADPLGPAGGGLSQ